MSAPDDEQSPDEFGGREFSNSDFLWVLELSLEPSYISEIARKLQDLEMPLGLTVAGPDNNLLLDEDNNVVDSEELVGKTWNDIEENTAVRIVGSIINLLEDNEDIKVESTEVGYDTEEGDSAEGQSQKTGSPHTSFANSGITVTTEWRDYKLVHNDSRSGELAGKHLSDRGLEELGERLNDAVDPSVTVEDKSRVVRKLSRLGNNVSRIAENIIQDVMERQFRYYDTFEYGDYNDPGVDFYVNDKHQRDYGLIVEASVRWVNPIDRPYIESKKEEAMKRDADLLILAPKFTDSMLDKYEDYEDEKWHSEPEGDIVHLHEVPGESERVYRPFAKAIEDITDRGSSKGNPIIVPDNKETREWLKNNGHVGDNYPVTDSEFDDFINLLDGVNRDFEVIRESEYRHMVRESIEPLLWEFMRPYWIEQFLIDTYWDKGMTQKEVGRLVDRDGGTIGEWMGRYGIITRARPRKELSDDVRKVWRHMYLGLDPFPDEGFSGYRVKAEYDRHPLWNLSDWEDWYNRTSKDERKEIMEQLGNFRDGISYTVMAGPKDMLVPSYTFIINTLREMGVEIRPPDEAPRGAYDAYPSKDAMEYMINKNQNTIVEVSRDE